MLIPLLATLLSLIGYVSALDHTVQRRATIPSPLNDPFYNPPSGWESANPGEVFRSREVDLAFLQIDRYNYKAAYQLLYRTTGGEEDEPSHSVTTVIIPHNAKKEQLVSYLPYIDAGGAQCAPSYSMRLGGKLATDAAMNYQQILLTSLLDEGWILSVADYQGPQRAFAVGRLQGRMTLDGLRATLNFKEAGLSKNAKVMTHGYSGGAIASGWSAALHASYAPELNAVGFSMGGTPSNLTKLVQNADGGLLASFVPAGVGAIAAVFPKFNQFVQERVTDAGRAAIAFTRKNCLINIAISAPFNRFLTDKYFRNSTGILNSPEIQSTIGDFVLGLKPSETPKAPVYMFHGRFDELIEFGVAINTAMNWTKHGADVWFNELTELEAGHLVTELTSIPNVIFFIRDRFAGKKFPKGLTRTYEGNGLENINADAQGLKSLVTAIQDLIGRQVGPGDSIFKSRIRQHAL